VLVLQSLLIVGLLYEHRRRRRAEVEASRMSELAHMKRSAAVGQMSACNLLVEAALFFPQRNQRREWQPQLGLAELRYVNAASRQTDLDDKAAMTQQCTDLN
jgi:hypothetical protein